MTDFMYLETAVDRAINDGSINTVHSDGNGGLKITGQYNDKPLEIKITVLAFLDTILEGHSVRPKVEIKFNGHRVIYNASIPAEKYEATHKLIEQCREAVDEGQAQSEAYVELFK